MAWGGSGGGETLAQGEGSGNKVEILGRRLDQFGDLVVMLRSPEPLPVLTISACAGSARGWAFS